MTESSYEMTENLSRILSMDKNVLNSRICIKLNKDLYRKLKSKIKNVKKFFKEKYTLRKVFAAYILPKRHVVVVRNLLVMRRINSCTAT